MIRNYEEGKGEGIELQVKKIPKLKERWNVMYEWIIVLIGYIEKMQGWDVKAMRTDRMKIVIQEVAGLGERKGTKDLKSPIKDQVKITQLFIYLYLYIF